VKIPKINRFVFAQDKVTLISGITHLKIYNPIDN